MSTAIIHLLSIAGSDHELPAQLGLRSAREVVDFVQEVVGDAYRVTANTRLMDAVIDPARGGRQDDALRIRELNRVLADERITAVVALRGGSWLTRVLPHVDFEVLRRRKTRVHIFGFSELTTLINIASRYRRVRAFYDLCPAYLFWSMKQAGCGGRVRCMREFSAFFQDVTGILSGECSRRRLVGRLVRGRLPKKHTIRVVGGCLSVLITLLGSRHAQAVNTRGAWLALEDVDEEIHRIDRMLAQLKLAGMFNRLFGILLGSFTLKGADQTRAVLELLEYHLPRDRELPIIARCNFGHCYPFSGLPINQPVHLITTGAGRNLICRFLPVAPVQTSRA